MSAAAHTSNPTSNTPSSDEKSSAAVMDRVMKDVIAPPMFPLQRDQLIDKKTGLPSLPILKEHFQREGRLAADLASYLVSSVAQLFRAEPNMLELKYPITVCGDLHGQFFDLIRLFEVGGDPKDTQYLFLGDYVDRGCFSCEVVLYLYALKMNYPKTLFMLRGNHECRQLTSFFNFKDECIYKYNLAFYDEVMSSFDNLPLAALVNKAFFCVHGGLSPDVATLEEVRQMERFQEIPREGAMCDLLWSDPFEEDAAHPPNPDATSDSAVSGGHSRDDHKHAQESTQWFGYNETRQCSYIYGVEAVKQFLKDNKLTSVIRAHEAQVDGYKMQMINKGRSRSAASHALHPQPLTHQELTSLLCSFCVVHQPPPPRALFRFPLTCWLWLTAAQLIVVVFVLCSSLGVCRAAAFPESSPSSQHPTTSAMRSTRTLFFGSLPSPSAAAAADASPLAPCRSLLCVGQCDVYKNKAACLKFDNNVLNIKQFIDSPHPYYLPNFMDVFQWSLPFVAEKVTDMLANVLEFEGQQGGSLDSMEDEADDGVVARRGGLLKKKVLGVSKLLKMYKILRQEQEAILQLKQLIPSQKLPFGLVSKGPDAIQTMLTGFDSAKDADSVNEKRPTPPNSPPISPVSTVRAFKAKPNLKVATSSKNEPLSPVGPDSASIDMRVNVSPDSASKRKQIEQARKTYT